MNITILKDCPFCGGKARLSEYDPYDGYQGDCTHYIVSCTECGAKVTSRKEAKSVAIWNKRVK